MVAAKVDTDLDLQGASRITNAPVATASGEVVTLGQGVVFVNFGTDTTTARPAGAAFVVWYGEGQPDNIVAPDVVVRVDLAT